MSEQPRTASSNKLIQPLPWKATRRAGFNMGEIHDAQGFILSEFTGDEAEFIVRACNAHNDLLAALKSFREATRTRLTCGCSEVRCALCRQADAAIAKAEGSQS